MSFDLKKYHGEYQKKYRKDSPVHAAWHEANKEKIREYQKEYRAKNKHKRAEYTKANIEKLKAQKVAHHARNKSKYNNLSKEWYKNNIDKKRKYLEKHKDKFQKIFNERRKERRKTDPDFKLISTTRNRIKVAVKNNQKSCKSIHLLGCTIQELRKHLESKFLPGMSWENYSYRGWHIDHIVPCASFDLSKEDEQKKCFHYSNLQPLWAVDNIKKGSKILNAA
jgi:hypothetical protein